MGMKIDEIVALVKDLSRSQGFYGRLYRDLMETKEEDPDRWDQIVATLEDEGFEQALDVILYFEEGKHHKKLTIDEQVEEIISERVSMYSRSDYSGTVYIYDDLAYIDEQGYDNMVEQIKEDYNLKEEN